MGNVNEEICEIVRSRLDAYLDSELVVEETKNITRHLESCAACSEMADDVLHAKKLLRRAVKSEVASDSLREKIQKSIRAKPRNFEFLFASKYLTAAAIILFICFGVFGIFIWHSQSDENLAGQANFSETLSGQTMEMLSIGLDDHIHCALENGFAKQRSDFEEMSGELGAAYIGLAPLMKEKTDGGFEVVAGHHCISDGRNFVHLILKKDEKILSLAVTKKNGETFSGKDGIALLQPSGVALYQENIRDFAVVGFETETNLVFFVSNLSGAENLRITSAAAPAVQNFLNKSGVNS